MQAVKKILSFSSTYELPIAKEYVRHWKMPEAVREIIQNALDSESPFEYEFSGDRLLIHSRNSYLTPETLLLGKTSKADDKDSIGSFGEGYKIALLVLTREGYPVHIFNRDRVWQPRFRTSSLYKAEVLCIEDSAAEKHNEGLTFEIQGLSPSDIEAIKESCLYMQDNIGEFYSTSKGRILFERPGKLYVGSLFICNTELEFGYDIKPEFLRLERDRQTVSSFDLQWLVKDMWFETERFSQIAELIERECPDLKYANFDCPEIVKEECYKLFRKRHPEAIVASSQEELSRLVAIGMEKVIYVGASYGSIVSSSPSYQATVKSPPPTTSPQLILQAWFSAHRSQMRKDAIVSFKDILKESANWRLR